MTYPADGSGDGLAGTKSKAIRLEARSLMDAGRSPEAKTLLQRYLANSPTDMSAQCLLGFAAFRSGDSATAIIAFDTCVQADPTDSQAFFGLGVTYRQRGHFAQAHQAFAAALKANPNFEKARDQLSSLPPGSAPDPGVPPASPQSQDDAGDVTPPPVLSLAELLDRRGLERPSDESMGGATLYAGRASIRSLGTSAAVAVILLAAPLVIKSVTESVPPSLLRSFLAGVWGLLEAVSWPIAFLIVIIGCARWLTSYYLIRDHRIEVTSGIIRRQHVIVWLHDLERPLAVKQNLWDVVIGISTLQMESTILPSSHFVRRRDRGRLRIRGLRSKKAEELAKFVWAEALWERRRMVANFVSSR